VSAGGPDAESGDADAAAYVASFTALQRPATSQDDLPSDPGNGTITTARRFADAPYGAWIALEGDSQICVIVALAGTLPSACDSPASLAQSNQLLITSAGAGYDPPSAGNTGARPPDQVLAGIAPDGVAAVTIEFSDGSSRTVAVHDNGFETALGSPNPVGFRWSTHGVEYTQGEAS
jgi:hypothetical protein